MRCIRIIEQLSPDGVIQAPGGPEEGRENGFEHGGRVLPHSSEEGGAAIDKAHGAGFDLQQGRKFHDIFAGCWPHQTGPMADSLNGAAKFVASHRPDSLTWGPVEGLGADVAAGIARLKAGEGSDLIVWASSTLTRLPIAEGLADELLPMVFPVPIGRGKRIVSDLVRPGELTLIESRATPNGVILSTYEPAGAMRIGCFRAGGQGERQPSRPVPSPQGSILQGAIPCFALPGRPGPVGPGRGGGMHRRRSVREAVLGRYPGATGRSVRAEMGGVDTRSRALGQGGVTSVESKCLH